MTNLHCPVCDFEFEAEKRPGFLPFCSRRCKLIDQGRWLGEAYGLPYESEDSAIPDDEELRQILKQDGVS